MGVCVSTMQEEVAGEVCALNDTQFNSLADELQRQLPLVRSLPPQSLNYNYGNVNICRLIPED